MFRLAITGLLFILCCGIAPAAEPMEYAVAYQEFQVGNRPMLVLVTSRGCGPCKLFKEQKFLPTFRDGRLSRVVPTIVEMESHIETYESIRISSGIQRIPALILYRKFGTRLVKEAPTQEDLDNFSQGVPDFK